MWGVFAVLLFKMSPTPFHLWRRCLLRGFGAKVGKRVGIYPTSEIWAPWNVSIADGATIGDRVTLYSVDLITIGAAAVISQGAHLCTASHDHNSEHFDLITAPIEIGANAWVAADAFVGPGVVLGEGAVAAARAVVIQSVADRAVVAGSPARWISDRQPHGRNVLVGRVK
jgi:putative colanic acid biosynthesis acetyltransferase WcaF